MRSLTKQDPSFVNLYKLIKPFLHLHPLQSPDDYTRVEFVGTFLLGSTISWLTPLVARNSLLLRNFDTFLEFFLVEFEDSDWKKVEA
jgi:hypothetical protein